MKMKKLLSIGAIGLVLACSTSVGASAAERPTNEKIKNDMIAMFIQNKSPLTYNVNSSTQVGNVINIAKLKEDLNKYGFSEQNYKTLNEALGLINSSKTIMDNAKTIVLTLSDENKLGDLLSDTRNLATTLREIENSNDVAKSAIENDIRELIKGSNSSLNVFFGKNVDGKITMSITQGSRIVLQLNSGNAYTISNSLGNDVDKLTQYAAAMKLFMK